jgi:hypothetical protein
MVSTRISDGEPGALTSEYFGDVFAAVAADRAGIKGGVSITADNKNVKALVDSVN